MDRPRPLRVQRHASPTGSWELVHAVPAAPLWPHVRRYCEYAERSSSPVRRREVPAPQVTVILSLGPEIDVLRGPAPRRRIGSFVASLDDTHSLTEYTGAQHGVELKLDPLTARRLFGLPMHELAGPVVELEHAWGPAGSRLPEMLHGAVGWAERFELVDAFLTTQLAATAPPRAELSWAWSRLRRSGGGARIGALGSELGWSPRRLVREFRDGLGMAPKSLARLLRFERVTRRLQAEGPGRLAEIALECGYYDQPHLNRDFRELAGTSPGRFAASLMPQGGVAP